MERKRVRTTGLLLANLPAGHDGHELIREFTVVLLRSSTWLVPISPPRKCSFILKGYTSCRSDPSNDPLPEAWGVLESLLNHLLTPALLLTGDTLDKLGHSRQPPTGGPGLREHLPAE